MNKKEFLSFFNANKDKFKKENCDYYMVKEIYNAIMGREMEFKAISLQGYNINYYWIVKDIYEECVNIIYVLEVNNEIIGLLTLEGENSIYDFFAFDKSTTITAIKYIEEFNKYSNICEISDDINVLTDFCSTEYSLIDVIDDRVFKSYQSPRQLISGGFPYTLYSGGVVSTECECYYVDFINKPKTISDLIPIKKLLNFVNKNEYSRDRNKINIELTDGTIMEVNANQIVFPLI